MSASWFVLRRSRALARRHWSTPCGASRSGSDPADRAAGSVSSTTRRARPTCQCWKRSGGCAVRLTGASLLALQTQHAPSWLAQLPGLLSPTELAQVQQRVQGTTRQRMLRELADALEVLTTDHPLVLVLEDLHWSDVSTLEFLAYLARRQEQTRLNGDRHLSPYRSPAGTSFTQAHPRTARPRAVSNPAARAAEARGRCDLCRRSVSRSQRA